MRKNKRSGAFRLTALVLALVQLFCLAACRKQNTDAEATTAPAETEAHIHVFAEGVCECGEGNGFDGFAIQTDAGLKPVEREDAEAGMLLTSSNAAGEMQSIRLNKEIDAVYGHYYEVIYKFTSNVAGTVRFVSEDAAYYETNEFEVKKGENEIAVRFAAGAVKDGKVNTSLELGGLDKFRLAFSAITCEELQENLSAHFLDVAPEKATGRMEKTGEGHLVTTFKTDEGWRVKLAVDRNLVKGRTYETTFVFTKTGGKAQNVTYTVYDGAATILGSNTKLVDRDLCVATFYFTANQNVKKGTCLEIGLLSGGEDVSVTFTYIDFKEVSEEKLAKLQAENPFPGVNVWTDASLKPATGIQSSKGLAVTNANPATDWWKVKLEQNLDAKKGSYYSLTFKFTSNTTGKIKFVNDDAAYYGSNEFEVKKGSNTFNVEIKSGGNSYSCLELGNMGPCELLFTEISVKKIDKPTKPLYDPNSYRFKAFNVWTDSTVKALVRSDTATTMTLTSQNAKTDWWKIKLEKDLSATAGKCYEVTYTFTSDATGRIKFVNDEASYYGSNEHDVKVGENTFKVQFKYGGKPYSCLELGDLGPCKLVFKGYSIKEIAEPETNGMESYRASTDSSLTPVVREDTATSMKLTSTNAATDWWKVKLEKDLDCEKDKYYEMTYTFTSDVAGKIKFVNDNATYIGSNEYDVQVGENIFTVKFQSGGTPYSCLELGGLGPFNLEFTDITLKETEAPEVPDEHEHSFTNGVCTCGEKNGFENFKVQTDGSVTAMTRVDTATTMKVISTNAATDWWKMKVENNFATEAGKTYKATYTFTSNAEGDIKFGGDNMTCHTADVYHVVSGDNTFTVTFTVSASNAYNCLELGNLGAFELVFSSITLKETEAPEVPDEHEHSFVNGSCTCGEKNGFENFKAWNEGALTPVVREDTATTMKLTSENAAGDWWKVKLENNFATEAGKTYKATYTFTSNAEGDIKFGGDNMTCHTADVYHVVSGSNTFEVTFTVSVANTYNCLELGGLGAFELVFSSITLTETEAPTPPPAHEHSFVNGSCTCGEKNGFENFKAWNEGALTPVVREDTATTMKLTSANAGGDWWKVKLENNFATEAGKTYKATYTFTSNAEGDIKFGGDNMTCHTADVYHVVSGSNTFEVTFTVSASNAYNCLELGGLGQFELVFSSITLTETEAPTPPPAHEHSFVNGSCTCGEKNGFQGFKVWNEGALIPVVREDTATTMKLTSANAGGDWWKVKLENNFATEAGKTYKATYTFTSNAAGDIKFGGDNFTCQGADVYYVNVGANTFTVTFTVSASNAYTCLEMGGLGNFELVFTGIGIQEIA